MKLHIETLLNPKSIQVIINFKGKHREFNIALILYFLQIRKQQSRLIVLLSICKPCK